MMKHQAGEDDTPEWFMPFVLLSVLVCRPPTDGDQMKWVGFYGLQETLGAIRPHRQPVQMCF